MSNDTLTYLCFPACPTTVLCWTIRIASRQLRGAHEMCAHDYLNHWHLVNVPLFDWASWLVQRLPQIPCPSTGRNEAIAGHFSTMNFGRRSVIHTNIWLSLAAAENKHRKLSKTIPSNKSNRHSQLYLFRAIITVNFEFVVIFLNCWMMQVIHFIQ